MKTAVSIDNKIFEAAEKAAKELGLSRSSLYSRAIEEFVQNHLTDIITQKYNEVYKDRKLDEELDRLASDTLSNVEW
jgi:hypothetical protein